MKNTFSSWKKIRLKNYDYTQAGLYFVTVCTNKKKHMFCKITSNQLVLNKYGKIVESCWSSISDHFTHTAVDCFVVMPNHIHGIIEIIGNTDTACRVPTEESFGSPKTNSLSTIIRSFKSAVTKQIHLIPGNESLTIWQPRYYEHVIRNEKELNSIRQYIDHNPLRWRFDQENPGGTADKTEREFWNSLTFSLDKE